jgi:hypothetical protein
MSTLSTFKFKAAEIGKFSTKESDLILANFQKNCRIMGLTRGDFSMIDLIHSVLKKTGPAHVICTTWSAGIKDVNQVRWMLDSHLIRTFKLITDHSYSTRQRGYAASILELFGADNIRTSEIHAKFTLIHNENYKVCIRTSMNLNANRTCESFELDEDVEVFDFYMSFIEHTFGDMPKGFVEQSFRVNACLDKFFNSQPQTQTQRKWWTES